MTLQSSAARRPPRPDGNPHRAGAQREPDRRSAAPSGEAARGDAATGGRPRAAHHAHAATVRLGRGSVASAELLELMIERMGGALQSSVKGALIDLRV